MPEPVVGVAELNVAIPPVFNAPLIPVPPTTTKAPLFVPELDVPEAATKLAFIVATPDAVNVVNAPVLAVDGPIGVLFTLPPAITALAVLKFVATNVVNVLSVMWALANALM